MRGRWMMATAGLALALAVTMGIALGRTAPSAAQPGPGPGPRPAQSLDQLSGDAFDQAWLHEMIMHHAMAVMMARPVAEKAQHQELKDLAASIIADQTREIAEMRGWLKDWYGVDMPDPVAMMDAMRAGQMPSGMPMSGMGQGPMHGPHEGMMPGGQMPMPGMMGGRGMGMGGMMAGMMGMGMNMMAQLSNLPVPRLEAMFMTMMVPHHQVAVDVSGLADVRAAHTELKELAGAIIAGQSAEIDQMNGWLKAWYGL